MSPEEMRRASHRELVEEAERRGVPRAEWMDKEALLRALRDAEGQKTSPLERARRFLGRVTGLGRVVDTVRAVVEPPRPRDVTLAIPSTEAPDAQVASRLETPRQLEREPLLDDPGFAGLRSVTRGGKTALVWRAEPARLAEMGSSSNELTLRIVSIACAFGGLDADVVVSSEDVTGVPREGTHALAWNDPRPNQVAAIGLGRGASFVALAHTRVL